MLTDLLTWNTWKTPIVGKIFLKKNHSAHFHTLPILKPLFDIFSFFVFITDAYQIRISAESEPMAGALDNNNMNNNYNNYNTNEAAPLASKKLNGKNMNGTEAPLVTYETSGEGKKLPIVIFNCNALSQAQPLTAGMYIW